MLSRLSHLEWEPPGQHQHLPGHGHRVRERAHEQDGPVRHGGLRWADAQVPIQLRGPNQLSLRHRLRLPQQRGFRQKVPEYLIIAKTIYLPHFLAE